MEKYELTVILDGKTTPAKKNTFQEFLEKLIKVSKGKTIKLNEWGVKDLSYKIGKSTTGLYLHYILELECKEVKAITTKLNQEGAVLRHLLVRVDEKLKKKEKK